MRYEYSGKILSTSKNSVYLDIDIGFGFSFDITIVAKNKIPQSKDVVLEVEKIKSKEGPIYVGTFLDKAERGYFYRCRFDKVYDGDTATKAVVDLGFGKKYQTRLRLAGINAPEVRGAGKKKGLESKARLEKLVLGKERTIRTVKDKTGKYGRYLAVVYYRNKNVNQLLLDEGLAVPYGEIPDY
jgi:micrococcal nuclease